ncbi:MAG TPA: hypothetical protein VGS20_01280 [Candidatus Acidoferrales bacterium]|nr:hypothetical protein [Candidatus Acidoferrales bacterium]
MADEQTAGVQALVRVTRTNSAPGITLTIVRYPGQEIGGIHVRDEKGRVLHATAAADGAMLRVQVEAAGAGEPGEDELAFALEYQVRVSPGRLERIPLPVPDAVSSYGQQPVRIAVTLPDGAVPVGDDFPAFAWREATRGYARLSDVPSLAMVDWKPAGRVTLADALLTSSALTDAGMLLILGAGSAIWWLRRRRGDRFRKPGQVRG